MFSLSSTEWASSLPNSYHMECQRPYCSRGYTNQRFVRRSNNRRDFLLPDSLSNLARARKDVSAWQQQGINQGMSSIDSRDFANFD